MNKVMSLIPETDNVPVPQNHFNQKQIDILKNSICKGVSNEEFEIFLMACTKTQLDPFMKQIYAVKRKSKKPDGTWGETMTIQTGIDGYRLIAERTGHYAPGPEPTYVHDAQGNLVSATSYIKKQTRDGTWHIVSASAYVDEYMQTFTDKQTGQKTPTGLWQNMPRTMLAKCAESQALRKAFPAEMSGLYTKEEMIQAETPKISLEQESDLMNIISECDEGYKQYFFNYLKKECHGSISDIPLAMFEKIRASSIKNMNENFDKQKKIEQKPEVPNE